MNIQRDLYGRTESACVLFAGAKNISYASLASAWIRAMNEFRLLKLLRYLL